MPIRFAAVLLTCSAMFAIALAARAPQSAATAPAGKPAAPAAGSTDAAALYKLKCQPCHLATGNSPIKDMNFTDGEWKHGSSVKEIAKVISEGVKTTAMLSYKTQFTEEQILALAKYVRAFDKKLKPSK